MDEHIKVFFVATHILGVAHTDVVVRLFVEILVKVAVDWFYHLDDASITSWAIMKTTFKTRFKTTKDEYSLLA